MIDPINTTQQTSDKTLTGMVIFYDVKTGVGEVNCADGAKYSFSHKAVEGLWIPGAGDHVTFTLADPDEQVESLHRIRTIAFANVNPQASLQEAQIVCPHCHHTVKPQIRIYEGQPDVSVCPDCGQVIGDYARKDKLFWLILCLTFVGVAAIAFWSFG